MKKHIIVCFIILLLLSSSFVGISKPVDVKEESVFSGPPMDSAWPMSCHDTRHTGRSPYSTADTNNIEKWKFYINCWFWGCSPAIDNEGTIYIGDDLYAIYPDGSLKWKCEGIWNLQGTPAIDENGILYVGTAFSTDRLYAIYTSDGTIKWQYNVGGHIWSSPAIAVDGTIYFGSGHGHSGSYYGYINALYPNGTLRWRHKTNDWVQGSPAIGDDGTVYCGSYDHYFYALYPNGTLKWKFNTADHIVRGPCIGDDGIIYCGTWYDGKLFALYPNGTMKWRYNAHHGSNPVIAEDGTIYLGGSSGLVAVTPDGTTKWRFDPGPDRTIHHSDPCISADGTIYFGTTLGLYNDEGGEIIAVNPDGTEKWRKWIANDWVYSSPIIGADGTVYIGSTSHEVKDFQGTCKDMSYLHAFGPVESNEPPEKPKIWGETSIKPFQAYYYKVSTNDPDRNPVSFFIDWGDGRTEWTWEYASGEVGYIDISYIFPGVYTIRVKAKDTLDAESDWETLKIRVRLSKDRTLYSSMFSSLLEHFPLLQKLLFSL
jgi:outer membrane protein assembly factor BamB